MSTLRTKSQLPPPESKVKLLDAARDLIRAKGFNATTVDDICKAAGVTKGSFFHHFESKEDLAVQGAEHFAEMAAGLFAGAPYRALTDPLDRFLAYIDFRREILRGELPQYTCLLGTMVQEVYETHPPIREACEKFITLHVAELTKDIQAAKELYAPADTSWTAEGLAYYTQAVLQGAFILAKAKDGPEIAAECITHLRRYAESLFTRPDKTGS